MKTKTLFLSAIAALTVYSCSSERDEQVQNNQVETKIDLKKEKTNNQGSMTAKDGDSTTIQPKKLPSDPPTPTDPNDPGTEPVVDPTKPDKPW